MENVIIRLYTLTLAASLLLALSSGLVNAQTPAQPSLLDQVGNLITNLLQPPTQKPAATPTAPTPAGEAPTMSGPPASGSQSAAGQVEPNPRKARPAQIAQARSSNNSTPQTTADALNQPDTDSPTAYSSATVPAIYAIPPATWNNELALIAILSTSIGILLVLRS